MKKMTTEEFILKARKVHGDKYDYSKVTYTNSATKVCIICPEHGEFWQQASVHLLGHGCPACSGLKRPSTEEFIEAARKVHGDRYDYSKVEYKDKDTKVCIICPIHGEFWQRPHNHIHGRQGCPECGKKYAREWRKNEYSKFLDGMKEKFGDQFSFPNIETEYENNKSRVTIKCNKCGHVFTKRPNDLMCSQMEEICQQCRKNQFLDSQSYTYDDLCKYPHENEIVPFEGKIHKDSHVTLVCKKHGEYESLAKSIVAGKCQCKKCSLEYGLSKRIVEFDTFAERLKEKYGDLVTPIPETYKNTMAKMTFECNTCGHIFERDPNTFMFSTLKNPCPACSAEETRLERTKTTEQYIQEVISVHGPNAFSFDKTVYTSSYDKVTLTCNKCGKDFTIMPGSVLKGYGCPRHHRNKSFVEEEVAAYIMDLGFNPDLNERSEVDGIELDIFVRELGIAFEINGIYWHCEMNKENDYHLKKTEACLKEGIRLIHIFDDEWLYRKDTCKSMIANILGKTPNKIYARKCEIHEVSPSDASSFLDDNHIQGKCGSIIRYGLYYNHELVSIMTFGKTRHFIGNSSHQYELLRFCNKKFTNVIGGASKLFKHFINEQNPDNVVSYADRRWSLGGMYYKLGFNLYNISKPNYFYIIKTRRKNRFSFRKSILIKKYGCPEDMSEHEFCKSHKWYRIYDCGSLCFEWINNNQ